MNSISRETPKRSDPATARWDFLTNHAHVLLSIAQDPGIRLRDIAAGVGITERGAHRILSLRHPLVQEREVGDLLDVLLRPERSGRSGEQTRSGAAMSGAAMVA